MKRGDIYLANINPRLGSEQKGIRPIIIVSHDGFNTTINWHSILIVPVSTSQKQLQRGPTVVQLLKADTCLEKDSFAICHQVTTLDKEKLSKHLGTLSKKYMKQVEQALKYAFDMFDE